MKNKVFRILALEIKIGQLLQQVSKYDLWMALKQINQSKPWGFNDDPLPDKQWMINILHSLQANHFFFQAQYIRKQFFCYLIGIQNPLRIQYRRSQGRFFKRSKTQVKEYAEIKIKEKQLKQQQKQDKRKRQDINLNQQIESLERNQIQEEQNIQQ